MSATRLKSAISLARKAVDDAAASIDRLRVDISALKQQREAIASAPLPLPDALAGLRAHLDHLAEQAASDLNGIAISAAGGAAPSAYLALWPQRNPLQLIAALARPQVEEALAGVVERHYRDNGLTGLTPAERDAQLAEIDQRITALEHEEEQTILQAEELGLAIPRRADADPATVLGL